MTDLITFLRARLEEDEALIRRNSDGHGLCDGFPDYRTYVDGDTKAADEYIEHFGPARTLREVEADRALLDLYDRAARYRDRVFAQPEPRSVSDEMRAVTQMMALEQVLRLRAAVYSDRPDAPGPLPAVSACNFPKSDLT